MFKEFRLVFLYTESPVHPGAGDSAGVVDLPVQREVHTELPYIQGSETKGALRENCAVYLNDPDHPELKQVFGAAAGNGSGGALGFSGARLVLFPIASLKGIFAYVTCPLCLENLKRDIRTVAKDQGIEAAGLDVIPLPNTDETALVPQGVSSVTVNGKVIFGDFALNVQSDDSLNKMAQWLRKQLPEDFTYWRRRLYHNSDNTARSNLVVVSDDMFRLLTQCKTEVVHRNVIDHQKGTSDNTWTEENIPADTLFYALLYAADPYDDSPDPKDALAVVDYLESKGVTRFTLGGSQTVGRGWIRSTFYPSAFQTGSDTDQTDPADQSHDADADDKGDK